MIWRSLSSRLSIISSEVPLPPPPVVPVPAPPVVPTVPASPFVPAVPTLLPVPVVVPAVPVLPELPAPPDVPAFPDPVPAWPLPFPVPVLPVPAVPVDPFPPAWLQAWDSDNTKPAASNPVDNLCDILHLKFEGDQDQPAGKISATPSKSREPRHISLRPRTLRKN